MYIKSNGKAILDIKAKSARFFTANVGGKKACTFN
jgi:hypothetical protein